jgi:ferredoxin
MAKRKIIEIDGQKCNGCGQCIPNCPEGAIQIIDNKARLVSDLFCDGLGACIGHCPHGAIKIVEREAEPYDERKVMANIVKHGDNTIKAHLEHLRDHGQEAYLKEAINYLEEKGMDNIVEDGSVEAGPEGETEEHGKQLPCGCPGAMMRDMRGKPPSGKKTACQSNETSQGPEQESELRQWPVQLTLVPPNAPYFNGADLLVSADCVPFANPNFHSELLKGRSLVIGCPKLDDIESYREKLTDILKTNDIKSITVAIMEVPCCHGMLAAAEQALAESGKKGIALKKVIVGVSGEM